MKKVISSEKFPVKIWADDLEYSTEQQLRNIANLPIIFKHIAVMPDAHWGMGATIGSVIASKGAVIPAAVGVDLGCGMCAVRLPFKVDVFGDDLKELRSSIECSIPVGFERNNSMTVTAKKAMYDINFENKLSDKAKDFLKTKNFDTAHSQMGSLGGGNHFVEVCQDRENNAWVMLHSGSRNIGKVLADLHIKSAKDNFKKLLIDEQTIKDVLRDIDLAYLVQNTPEFDAYINDLMLAQKYAKANRDEMMRRVLKDISYYVYGHVKTEKHLTDFRVDCHHNYVAIENHYGHNVFVTRKGAVRAREGEWGIIPGSMGTRSYIVKGKGNPESFYSCSHGAGRIMSRREAKRRFTEEDVREQTKGVECRKDSGIIDELPGAYKDIGKVMENQKDLVEPIYELKALLCIKG